MLKALVSTILLSLLCQNLAAEGSTSLYQIDLIIFTHQQNPDLPKELSLATGMLIDGAHAITLQSDQSKGLSPYHLLPSSSSHLKQEYWALNRKPDYHVLAHYSWLQPFNSQRPITLPTINKDGWQLEGNIQVRRSNYYLLDTNLVFSKPENPESSFVIAQKQRLKGGDIYYLDHPQAGILVKVHQIG